MSWRSVLLALLALALARAQGVEQYLRDLEDADPATRQKAIYNLAQLGPQRQILERLVNATQDPAAAVRRSACYNLGMLGPDARTVVPALVRALDDPDDSVHASAARALGSIGPASVSAIWVLAAGLQHPNEDVRWASAQGLEGIGRGSAPAKEALIQALSDRNGRVRATALGALVKIEPGQELFPRLFGFWHDSDRDVRQAAVLGLRGLGPAGLPALPWVLQALEDKDYVVQGAAIATMFDMGPRNLASAVPALIATLNNGDNHFSTRSAAADLLAAIGAPARIAIRDLERAQSADHDWVRRAACRALEKLGHAPAPSGGGTLRSANVDQLAARLAAPDPQVRLATLRELARLEWRASAAIPAVVKVLAGGTKEEQIEAIRVLGSMKSNTAPAVTALLRAMQNHELRTPAINALGGIGEGASRATPLLAALLSDPDHSTVEAAASALGRIEHGAAAATPALIRLLKNPDAGLRNRAITALSGIGPGAAQALPDLIDTLQDPFESNRSQAAMAIAQIHGARGGPAGPAGTEAEVSALVRALGDPNVRLRAQAAYALAWMGPGVVNAIPALVQALDDAASEVRREAALALFKVAGCGGSGAAPVTAIPALVRALGDPSPYVRYWAARALGTIGPAAASAGSALRGLLHDEDPSVRKAANEALQGIAPHERSKR